MRRLKHLLEHRGVEVLAPQDVLFARLLDLDDDGDDEEDEDDAAGDADDGPVGVVQVVQDAGLPVLCPKEGGKTRRKDETSRGSNGKDRRPWLNPHDPVNNSESPFSHCYIRKNEFGLPYRGEEKTLQTP